MDRSRRRPVAAVVLSVAALLAPAATPLVAAAAPTDLIISEYLEGSGSNKAIELYNGTGAPIDLAGGGYVLNQFTNGSLTATTIPLAGTISDGATFVIANPSADPMILALAGQTSSSLTFNGNDAIELDNFLGPVDLFGTVGLDPGLTGWGGGLTVDHDLVRESLVTSGRTVNDSFDPTLEWNAFPIDTFSNLGTHTIDIGNGGGGSDTGYVAALVTVPTSAACLEIASSIIDFGTLPPGSEDQPGSPDVTVTNCSALSGDVLVRGTDASAAGAHWSLVQSSDTCGALGLDNYRLNLDQAGTEMGLSTTNQPMTTLASGASATRTARIFTACPGSSGSGATMIFQLIFLATSGG